MKATTFDEILERRMGKIRAVLQRKAEEYATDDDRLDNFKVASGITGGSPAQACLGFMAKHLASLKKIIDDDAAGVDTPTATIDEKVGDAINYLILLEAILLEKWGSG